MKTCPRSDADAELLDAAVMLPESTFTDPDAAAS